MSPTKMRITLITHTIAFATLSLVVSLYVSSIAKAGEITVYTSLGETEIKEYLSIAKADMPDLKVNVLRLSTGILATRLLKEGSHPHYDVIWGWALTNMLAPRIQSLIAPYKPKGSERMPDQFKDMKGMWFAPTGYMAALCINTDRLNLKGLPMPTGWSDLVNPVYKGEIVMPNPSTSGTGFLQVVSILQGMGGEMGWSFLKHLNKNVALYSKTGAQPCNLASEGKYAIGASSAIEARDAARQGFPIKMVIPKEGAGYELDANALSKFSKHPSDAKRFLDWTISDSIARVYGKYAEIVGIDGVLHDANIKKALFRMNFKKSMEAHNRTLKRWHQEIER